MEIVAKIFKISYKKRSENIEKIRFTNQDMVNDGGFVKKINLLQYSRLSYVIERDKLLDGDPRGFSILIKHFKK